MTTVEPTATSVPPAGSEETTVLAGRPVSRCNRLSTFTPMAVISLETWSASRPTMFWGRVTVFSGVGVTVEEVTVPGAGESAESRVEKNHTPASTSTARSASRGRSHAHTDRLAFLPDEPSDPRVCSTASNCAVDGWALYRGSGRSAAAAELVTAEADPAVPGMARVLGPETGAIASVGWSSADPVSDSHGPMPGTMVTAEATSPRRRASTALASLPAFSGRSSGSLASMDMMSARTGSGTESGSGGGCR